MEQWLEDHLRKLGRLNSDGVGRRVSGARCRTCHVVVLRALDGDICAMPVTVDPDPVSVIGEFLAVTQGRRTYDLMSWRSNKAYSYCLEFRRPVHITRTRRYDVYAEHRCGAPLPKERVMR